MIRIDQYQQRQKKRTRERDEVPKIEDEGIDEEVETTEGEMRASVAKVRRHDSAP